MKTNYIIVHSRILFALFLCLSLLAAIEGAGRYFLPQKPGRYLFFPKTQYRILTEAAKLPHVQASANFSVNPMGLRGVAPNTQPIHWLAIGGSTTLGDALDDTKTWPFHLQNKLNETLGSSTYWIGNAGKNGHSLSHHIAFLKTYLHRYPNIDGVLLMVGSNDLLRAIFNAESVPYAQLSPSAQDALHLNALRTKIDAPRFWPWSQTWIHTFLIQRKTKRFDIGAKHLQRLKRREGHYQTIKQPKDLRKDLGAYESNLETLIRYSQRKGVRLYFFTHPHRWHQSPEKQVAKLLWGGCVGKPGDPKRYCYSPGAMETMMDQFNKRLLHVCQKNNVPCLDLAAKLPKSNEIFYDHVHFNELGTQKVAEEIAKFLQPHVQ